MKCMATPTWQCHLLVCDGGAYCAHTCTCFDLYHTKVDNAIKGIAQDQP